MKVPPKVIQGHWIFILLIVPLKDLTVWEELPSERKIHILACAELYTRFDWFLQMISWRTDAYMTSPGKSYIPLLYKSVISDTLGYAPQLFCSYHILTSSVIFYWTDVQQVIFYWFIHEKENLDYRESLALSQEEECPFPSTMCPAT